LIFEFLLVTILSNGLFFSIQESNFKADQSMIIIRFGHNMIVYI